MTKLFDVIKNWIWKFPFSQSPSTPVTEGEQLVAMMPNIISIDSLGDDILEYSIKKGKVKNKQDPTTSKNLKNQKQTFHKKTKVRRAAIKILQNEKINCLSKIKNG